MKEEIKEMLKLHIKNEIDLLNYINNLQEEKKRLNNILDELEKYIEEMRIYYCKELANEHNCIDLFIENSNKLNHIVNIKLKLKELRGDKN